jgi:hypothetical protein
MKARCFNPEHRYFNYYGGRGITVCDRWRDSFEAFLEDMGPKPSRKHSLDRYPDNEGSYSKQNCRWATSEEQANNRKNSTTGIPGISIDKKKRVWISSAKINGKRVVRRSRGCLDDALALRDKLMSAADGHV